MRMMSSMPSIPTIGEQYANAASYAREKGVAVDGDQETFGQRLTEVCPAFASGPLRRRNSVGGVASPRRTLCPTPLDIRLAQPRCILGTLTHCRKPRPAGAARPPAPTGGEPRRVRGLLPVRRNLCVARAQTHGYICAFVHTRMPLSLPPPPPPPPPSSFFFVVFCWGGGGGGGGGRGFVDE